MLILGIECTAHTFGIGIIDAKNKKILYNNKSQFRNNVGMDPRKLGDYHTANFDIEIKEVKKFLNSINKNFKDLDLISFSQGPGIGNALKIGALVAKTLSKKYDIPIIGVNHIKAHLEIGKMLTKFKDPLFLYVSGVNTQIIAKDESRKYKIYGETEDIGLGNLLDSFARLIDFDFPGGPQIEEVAKKGREYMELPYTIKGMNVSLAGIYSNLKKKIDDFNNKKPIKINENKKKRYENHEEFISDLCFSIQETAFAMLMEISERAMAYTNKKEFIIVGGVGANQRLSEMAKQMCEIRGSEYKSFPIQYAMDNGAMIAWQGYVNKDRASKNIQNLKPQPYINVENDL